MISIAKPSVRAEDHIGLVKSIAARYVRPGTDVEDSDEFGNGMLGLAKALQGYDGKRRFSTYATPVIVNSILDGLRRERRHRNHTSLDDVPETAAAEPCEDSSSQDIADVVRRLQDGGYFSEHVRVFLYYHTVCPNWRKVGEKFGIPKSTAQNWAQRILSRIRLFVSQETDVDRQLAPSKIRTRRSAAVA